MICVIPLILLTFISSTRCQHMDSHIRPDMTFGNQNERFDVEELVKEQKRLDKHFKSFRRKNEIAKYIFEEKESGELFSRPNTIKMRNGGREKWRRNTVQEEKNIVEALKEIQREDAKIRRDDGDRIESGLDEDYDRLVKKHQRPYRKFSEPRIYSKRSLQDGSDTKVLFHHAVPISFTVNGFLELPLDE